MVAQPSRSRFMSVDEWRELERQSDIKHEYIDGQIYAMAGATLAHVQISANAMLALRSALGNGPCYIYVSDAAARLSPTRYTYPDVVVTCDERDRPTTRQREVQAPRVVIEVLSPGSTEEYDRGEKFGYYRECPTVEEYVLVSTKRQLVEVFRRTTEGWTVYHVYGPGDEVELISVGVRISVTTFYEMTDVPEVFGGPKGKV